jgi:hypothetical protein
MTANLDDMLAELKNGYCLPCPEEALKIKTWSSKTIYDQLANMCFVADPMKRATFSDIVEQLEKELNAEEQLEYRLQSEQYASMSSLISDPNTQLKRSSKISESDNALYLKMVSRIDNQKSSHLNVPNKQTAIEECKTFTDCPSEENNDPKNNIPLITQEINDVTNKELDSCDYVSNEITQSEIFDYQNIDSDKPDAINVSLLQPNPSEMQTLSHGYITIQVANES